MPSPPSNIEQQCPGVWRGRSLRRNLSTLPTGHAPLDRQLPGRGWPLGTLTELLTATAGSGELSLLLPALARLSAQGQWVILLDPPWIPYPPAMHGHGVSLERVMLVRTRSPEESLWACEQVLRDIRGGAVLTWHDNPGFARLRRLQLAARNGLKAAFLFRSQAAAAQASPASLRLQLEPDPLGSKITVLKCQGRCPTEPIFVRRSSQVPSSACQPVIAGHEEIALLPPTGRQTAGNVLSHAH